MKAYSLAVATDGNAADTIRRMEPAPVKAEEDEGSMAQFMLDMTDKSENLDVKKDTQLNKGSTIESKTNSLDSESNSVESLPDTEASGADFAA
jgi:hypothetical protein